MYMIKYAEEGYGQTAFQDAIAPMSSESTVSA